MAIIHLKTFRGMRPRVASRLLSNEQAQVATGCHFNNGNLDALRKSQDTGDVVLSNAKTIFHYLNEHWFAWDKEVDVIKSPIANDPYQRVYWSGDGYPKVTNNEIFSGAQMPSNSYKLGVQAPSNKIGVAITEGATEFDKVDFEERYYTHTFVTAAGEEGAPGDVSDVVTVQSPYDENTKATLNLVPPATNLSNITHRRIYRSVTSASSAEYLLVAEIPIAQATYEDVFQAEELGPALSTFDYEMPPENLEGLSLMSNGICVGFFGNTICFSEPYLPYAWPSKYQRTTEDNIVALVEVGNSIVALTEGAPVIFSGVTPSSISDRILPSNQACVSARSAIAVDGTIVYASPDGLVALQGDGVVNLTREVFTREQWQALNPSTIEGYHSEGRYIGFHGVGLDSALVFEPSTGDLRFADETSYAGFNSNIDDALYLAELGTIKKWEASTEFHEIEWRSKIYSTLETSLNCGLIRGENLDQIGFRLYLDGALAVELEKGQIPVNAFRLPDLSGDLWEFEFYGTGTVHMVVLASSMLEIKGVLNG